MPTDNSLSMEIPEVPASPCPPQTVPMNPALPKPSPSKRATRDSSLKRYREWEVQSAYVEFLKADTERAKAQTELMKVQTDVFKLKKVQLETQLGQS